MKKLVFLLLLFSTTLKAQSLHDLLTEEGLRFGIAYTSDAPTIEMEQTLFFCGESTLCGLPFINLFSASENSTPRRETRIHIDGERVYRLIQTDNGCEKILLYDYSLEVGDTIDIFAYGDPITLLDIYPVTLLDGSTRLRYDFTRSVSWIYGLGDINFGLLPRLGLGQTAARCIQINSTILWESAIEDICETAICSAPVLLDFNFETNLNTVVFDDVPCYSDSSIWDFGDGNTSTEDNPNHTYSTSGCFQVSLTGFSDCVDDSTSLTRRVNICMNSAWEEDYNFELSNLRVIELSSDIDIAYNESNLLKSTDGGASWNALPIPLDLSTQEDRTIQEIRFFDDQRGIMLCQNNPDSTEVQASIYTSQDGGLSWNESYLSVEYPEGITLGDDGAAWTTGTGNVFLRTTDWGITWEEMPLSLVPQLENFIYVNLNTLFYVGNNDGNTMFGSSKDQGETWDNFVVFGNISSLSFFDDMIGYATIDNTLFVTENGGKIWTKALVPIHVSSVHFASPTHGWFTDEIGAWYYTNDALQSYSLVYCSEHDIENIEIVDETHAYATEQEVISTSPEIFKSTKLNFEVNLIGNIDEAQVNLNDNLEDLAIIPNPASSTINIQNPGFGSFTYEVYSMQGQLVMSGKNKTQIEINGLAQGTYILSLDYAKGEARQLGRFVVLR